MQLSVLPRTPAEHQTSTKALAPCLAVLWHERRPGYVIQQLPPSTDASCTSITTRVCALTCRQSMIAEVQSSLDAHALTSGLQARYVLYSSILTALCDIMCRQSIIAEVESSLAAQYAAMSQEELHQWHATLQQSLSEASDAHHKAKDYLKQVSQWQQQ